MESRPPITVTIVALNEEANIGRTIESVQGWANEILVVDSGSTDQTCSVASSMGARVLNQKWLGYGGQKNFAQENAQHDWVLNVDADEVVPTELKTEIDRKLEKSPEVLGYQVARKTYYMGRWIRHGGWYPSAVYRLANRRHARWTEPEVHEALAIEGKTERLASPLDHFSFNHIEDQVHRNLRYSRLGFRELVKNGKRPSLLKLIVKPWWRFIQLYVIKLGFLDGVAGLIIAVNAAHSLFLRYAYFFEDSLREDPSRR